MSDTGTILIMGASGTIGRPLVAALVANGQTVRAANRSRAVNVPGVASVRVDATSGEGLDDAFDGISSLFLLVGDMPDQTNAELRVIEAARRAGVTHIVKLSTWGAQSEAFSIARIHRPVELALERSGLDYTFLRPNCFMQNFVTYYRDMIRVDGVLRLPCGDAKVSFIDARDIAAVAARVLVDPSHRGKSYDLSGPQSLTHADAADRLSAAAGRAITYENVAERQFQTAMQKAGMPSDYIQDVLELCTSYRSGDAAKVTPAVSDITQTPGITFAEFACDHASVLR